MALALLLAPVAALNSPRLLRKSAESAAVFCADVGVEISFPSRDVQAAMDELLEEDGAEGSAPSVYRPQSCLRSSLMTAIAGHMKSALREFAVSALDCVPEPLDWETSTVALFAVTAVCSRSNLEVGADMATWTAELKQGLDELYQLSSGHLQRIQLAKTTGMLRQVALSTSYLLPGDGNGVPVLDLQAVRLWSEGDDETHETGESYFTNVEVKVENVGTIPLHLFRLTVAKETLSTADGEGLMDTPAGETPGFMFPLVNPAAVDPGTSTSITFKTVTARRVDINEKYRIYVSHSGFRAHIFDGVLSEGNVLTFEKPAINHDALRSEGDKENIFSRFSFDSGLLDSQFPSFPFAFWQGLHCSPFICFSYSWARDSYSCFLILSRINRNRGCRWRMRDDVFPSEKVPWTLLSSVRLLPMRCKQKSCIKAHQKYAGQEICQFVSGIDLLMYFKHYELRNRRIRS